MGGGYPAAGKRSGVVRGKHTGFPKGFYRALGGGMVGAEQDNPVRLAAGDVRVLG